MTRFYSYLMNPHAEGSPQDSEAGDKNSLSFGSGDIGAKDAATLPQLAARDL
jgi:hypothetical protein